MFLSLCNIFTVHPAGFLHHHLPGRFPRRPSGKPTPKSQPRKFLKIRHFPR